MVQTGVVPVLTKVPVASFTVTAKVKTCPIS
jgi:hypothetical protein